jgi:hypothetical protein
LLGGVRASDQQQYGRIISVSVGYGDKPLRSDASTRLRPIRWFAALFFIIGLSLALLALLFLAWRSNLIRDIGPDPVSKDNKRLFRDKAGNLFTEEVTSDGKRTYKALDGLAQTDGKVRPVLKTFSLARTQLAFWVFVTVAAFFYIWLVTTDRQSLPTFVLGLLGISSATAVGSTLIDSSRLASQPDPDSLKQQLKALRDEQTTLQAKATRSQDEESRLNTLNTQIPGLEATIAQGEESKVTKGFWRDILSDDTGITIHRFQIVAWTLVLGTIFVITVINTLIMPNYDGTLLALMGISSGAFIALKPTENQSDPTKK